MTSRRPSTHRAEHSRTCGVQTKRKSHFFNVPFNDTFYLNFKIVCDRKALCIIRSTSVLHVPKIYKPLTALKNGTH